MSNYVSSMFKNGNFSTNWLLSAWPCCNLISPACQESTQIMLQSSQVKGDICCLLNYSTEWSLSVCLHPYWWVVWSCYFYRPTSYKSEQESLPISSEQSLHTIYYKLFSYGSSSCKSTSGLLHIVWSNIVTFAVSEAWLMSPLHCVINLEVLNVDFCSFLIFSNLMQSWGFCFSIRKNV